MEWQKRFLTHFHWCSLVSVWELQTVQDTKKECVCYLVYKAWMFSDKTRSLIVLYNYHLSLCVCVPTTAHTYTHNHLKSECFDFIVSIFIEIGKCNRCFLSLQYCILSHTWRLDIGIFHFRPFPSLFICLDSLKLSKANGVGCFFGCVSVAVFHLFSISLLIYLHFFVNIIIVQYNFFLFSLLIIK